MTDRPFLKLSSERVLAALGKMINTLEDPRVQLYVFFLEQLRPFTRAELVRMLQVNVLQLSADQVDRSLQFLFEKNLLGKIACGREVLYFPIV